MSGVFVECEECWDREATGYGGSAVIKVKPIELGLNAFKTHHDVHTSSGVQDIAGTGDRTTFGGYFEVDPGWLLFKQSLILGVGAFRTEFIADNSDFKRHDKLAAYIAYPLGFNDAMVKLVFSTAEYLDEVATDVTATMFESNTNNLAAVRARVSYKF